jgi:hypothetical protein
VFDASGNQPQEPQAKRWFRRASRTQTILLNDPQQEGVMTDRKAVEPCKLSDPLASQKVGVKQHSMRRTTDNVSAGEGLRLFETQHVFRQPSDSALDALIHRGHIKQYAAGDVICRRWSAATP